MWWALKGVYCKMHIAKWVLLSGCRKVGTVGTFIMVSRAAKMLASSIMRWQGKAHDLERYHTVHSAMFALHSFTVQKSQMLLLIMSLICFTDCNEGSFRNVATREHLKRCPITLSN